MDSRNLPVIDKINGESFTGLAGTPEGRLVIAVLLQAIDDLDFEIKNRFPLETLPWFYSDDRVLSLACSLLEWDKRALRQRIEERVEAGRQEMLKEIKEKKNEKNGNISGVRASRKSSYRPSSRAVRIAKSKPSARSKRQRTRTK